MANIVYTTFKQQLLNAGINFGTAQVKVALVSYTYTPSQDSDAFFSTIGTNEVTGIGYTAGGTVVTPGTVTTSTHTAVYSSGSVTWGTSTISAAAGVLYMNTGTASNSPLIGYLDFGGTQTSSAGAFTIQWNASGIVNLA